jgi:hypothetical protein
VARTMTGIKTAHLVDLRGFDPFEVKDSGG